MRKLFAFFIIFLFVSNIFFINIIADETVKPSITTKPNESTIVSPFIPKEEDILSTVINSIQYSLEQKSGTDTTNVINDLTILFSDISPSSKKFSFNIDAKTSCIYTAGFVIPILAYNFTIDKYILTINYSTFHLVYDFTDISTLNLSFEYGINKNNYFYFNATSKKPLPVGKHVWDPQYQITKVGVTTYKCLEPCPSATKLVRLSNGTLFMTYYGSGGTSAYIYRSIDQGVTWVLFETISFTILQYDMAIAVDSEDRLHWMWSGSITDGKGMRYKNWTAADGWSPVVNLTKYNTDGPECPHMVINASDAVYFFWYNRTAGSADKYNIQNKTLYKGVYCPIHNLTERKDNSSDHFMFGCCDNNDVIHLVWFVGDGVVDAIDYINITNNVRSPIRHLYYTNGVANDDQTAASIVCDNRNNLSIAWIGQPGDAAYETRHMYYWFANHTWSGIRNLGDVSTDGTTYPYPYQTVDWDNTVYISVSGSNAADEGQRYYKYGTNGTYSSVVHLTTNYKTTYNYCIYQNYPQFQVSGSTVWTMRPKSGFSVLYYNASNNISYFNESAYYSGLDGAIAPTPTNPSPTNSSTIPTVSPMCAITVADVNGDTMNVTFASNHSGAWVNYQTNKTVLDGTYKWKFTAASTSKHYWWKVFVNDSVTNVSATYNFELEAEQSWWDGHWTHSRRVNITNPLDDYVLNLTVFFDSGHDDVSKGDISLSGCNPDFSDVRVISSFNTTQLPYWISTNYTSSSHCELYFNNSKNESYVWLYYHNPQAKTTSNGTTTFLEFFNLSSGWQTFGGASTLYFHMNGSFLEIIKNIVGDHWKYRPITVGLWKNVTLEAQTVFKDWASIDNHNINFMISSDTHKNNLTTFSFYHKTTVPTIYGYKFDADNTGMWLHNDSTPFDKDIIWRADINTISSTIDYYLYNKSADKYFHTRQAQKYDDLTATTMDYFGFSMTSNYLVCNFTGGIRIKPFSENPPTIPSYGEPYIVTYSKPLNATNITTTSATLRGQLIEDTGVDNLVGFYVFTSPPTFPYDASCSHNITYGLCNDTTINFEYDISGLTSSEYYYLKTWCYNGTRWDYSNITTYFLTLPNPITDLEVIDSYYTTAALIQWQNPIVPSNTNLSVAIYYNTTGPITSRSQGTLAANVSATSGTLQSRTIYGLADETTYYFTCWTQINASGSPKLYQQAGSLVWTQAVTGRGNFNVTFYNETNPSIPLNLSRYGPHTIDVIYNNRTERNIIKNGVVTNESDGDFANLDNGYIWLNCTYVPLYIDVYWNNTEGGWGGQYYGTKYYSISDTTTPEYIPVESTFVDNETLCLLEAYNGSWWTVQSGVTINGTFLYNNTFQVNAGTVHTGNTTFRLSYYYALTATDVDYRCHRKQLFHDSENMSIYLAIAHPVYTITTSTLTNQTLIPYTYTFYDATGYFSDATGIDTYVTIYTYDSEGNLLIIHEEFWDVTDQIYPWLLYNREYRIGITCSEISIGELGFAPTSAQLNPTIQISNDEIITPSFDYDVFTFLMHWTGTGYFLHVTDSTTNTTEMTLSTYNYTTLALENRTSTTSYTHNFTITVPTDRPYILQLNITSPDFTDNITLRFPIFPGRDNITSYDSLNQSLTTILGFTPFFIDGDHFVSWVYILLFFLDILIIFTFSGFSGEPALAGIGVGLIHILISVLSSGISIFIPISGFMFIVLSVFYMYRSRVTA